MLKNSFDGIILVIDNEPYFCETAKEAFKRKTAICHYAENIDMAVKILENDTKKEIVLVLLDIRLESDKWKNHLNKIKLTNGEVKIIVITSHNEYNEANTIQQIIKCGADAFLMKPLSDKIDNNWDVFINRILEHITIKYVKIDTQFLLRFWNNNESNPAFRVNDKKTTIPESEIRDKIIQKYFNYNFGYKDVIRTYINQSKSIDWLLNITNKRYRDHYNHQFNVGLLGWFLLHVEVSANTPLYQYYCECGWKKEEIELAWWIAALLHDHGYPIAHLLQSVYARNFLINPDYMDIPDHKDHIKGINTAFMAIYSSIICAELLDHTKNYYSNSSKKEFQKIIEEQLFKIDKTTDVKNKFYDHGVISAVNLSLKLAGYIDEKIIKESLKAIYWHNLEDKNNIIIDKNPIAFLLLLCDSIQEWGRTIIIENEPYIETEKIYLGLRVEKREGEIVYKFPSRLQIGFVFDKHDILKTTKWNYGIFIDSLLKNLNRLAFFPAGPREFCKPKSKAIEILSTYN